jgi:hypothetical protein
MKNARLETIAWKFFDNDECLDLDDTRFILELCLWQEGFIEGLEERINALERRIVNLVAWREKL